MLTIRPETPEDETAIRHINEKAFGQKDEAELIDKLRHRSVLTISLIAVQDGKAVGHIAFSPVTIEPEEPGKSSWEAIALAPMAVLPEYQRKGIGSQLVRAGLKECQSLGQKIVFVVGYPDYYSRFGFTLAKPKGIDCEFKVPEEAFMVLELEADTLAGQRGTVIFRPEFQGAT